MGGPAGVELQGDSDLQGQRRSHGDRRAENGGGNADQDGAYVPSDRCAAPLHRHDAGGLALRGPHASGRLERGSGSYGECWALVLQAVRTMAAGAVRDRMAAVGAVAGALILLATAWVLGVAAVVLLLAGPLGTVGALASVTGALVVLALALFGLTRRHNRRTAEERATTRALWTATAVNAASALLQRGPVGRAEATAPEEAAVDGGGGTGGGGHRSALLIGGGLALILLGVFFPSGSEDATDAEAGPGPDDAA